MKKIWYSIVALLTLTYSLCFAQSRSNDDYEKFYRSFPQAIHYPVELYRGYTSSVCLIKVELDGEKNVVNMKLSESADSLLEKEFNQHYQQLDLKSLTEYLKVEYQNTNATVFLIPLSYSLIPPKGASGNVSLHSKAVSNYFNFDGKPITGSVVLLKPVGFLTTVQR